MRPPMNLRPKAIFLIFNQSEIFHSGRVVAVNASHAQALTCNRNFIGPYK